MRNKFLFCLSLLISHILFAQKIHYPVDSTYNKWIRSIINIECRTGNTKKINEQFDNVHDQASWDSATRNANSLALSWSSWDGTAIFLEDKGRHFLLTARHVLFDNTGMDSSSIVQKIIIIDNDTNLQNGTYYYDSNNNITDIKGHIDEVYLMNIDPSYYYFTSVIDDIGILCLDNLISKYFLKTIISRGYKPLHLKDIQSNFQHQKGESLFSLGFPRNSELRYGKTLPRAVHQWESNLISVPVLSKGIYLEEYPKKSNFFDAMMFVYKGFSGAPIVGGKNKIIGMVSAVEATEVFKTGGSFPFKYLFQNHSKFIKSSLIVRELRKFESRLDDLDIFFKKLGLPQK
ncbi:MAG TPA: trypsin-like peptidase domain-containing protein [Puia sp.]|nr:trypsin-like peptidase domain-containing protein [Puia sp.]